MSVAFTTTPIFNVMPTTRETRDIIKCSALVAAEYTDKRIAELEEKIAKLTARIDKIKKTTHPMDGIEVIEVIDLPYIEVVDLPPIK